MDTCGTRLLFRVYSGRTPNARRASKKFITKPGGRLYFLLTDLLLPSSFRWGGLINPTKDFVSPISCRLFLRRRVESGLGSCSGGLVRSVSGLSGRKGKDSSVTRPRGLLPTLSTCFSSQSLRRGSRLKCTEVALVSGMAARTSLRVWTTSSGLSPTL